MTSEDLDAPTVNAGLALTHVLNIQSSEELHAPTGKAGLAMTHVLNIQSTVQPGNKLTPVLPASMPATAFATDAG